MGKITVKHYLNQKLRPEIDDFDNSKYYPLYLTITVQSKNIKRKSNIHETISVHDFETNFENIPEVKRKTDYEKNLITRIIELAIKDISNEKPKKNLITFFDLKGYNSKDNFINILNAYIDFYSHSIYEAISNFCNDEIEKEVFDKLATVFNLSSQSEAKEIFMYQSPLQEIDFIYKNLSRKSVEYLVLRERLRSFLAPYSIKTGYDIPLIDWLDNLIQDELRQFLQTYKRKSEYYIKDGFVIDNQLIEKYITIIDNVVYSPNYIEIAKSRRKINL